MSDYDSSDYDLNKAIELSLKESIKAEVIDLLSDDDDDDDNNNNEALERPPVRKSRPTQNGPAESLNGSDAAGNLSKRMDKRPELIQNSYASSNRAHKENISDSSVTIGSLENKEAGLSKISTAKQGQTFLPPLDEASAMPSGLAGILGYDRKKMEEERLARARKRKASSISPPPLTRKALVYQRPSAVSVTDEEGDRLVSKKATVPTKFSSSAFESIAKTKPPSEPKSSGELNAFIGPRELIEPKLVTLADFGPEPHGDNQPILSKDIGARMASPPDVLSYRQQKDMLAPGIHFPNGIVKKTWVYGYSRRDDIKIEEVLQKDDLELAILSAYQWDEEWILSKLNMRKTKVICVVQAEGEEQKAAMRMNVPPNIKFCFPSMAGQIHCMHSKLQLLSHPSHLRIAVPSANLVPYDWGEAGGVMENTVFIIDLPRLPNGQKTSLDRITPFCRELLYFLRAMEMEETVTDSILNFDFSRTAHLAFIHSIGGSHSGTAWKRTGYCGLGLAIKELGLATREALEIDFVSASIGNLSNEFIMSIYLAAQGDDGTTELNWRTSKPAKSKTTNAQSKHKLDDAELRLSKELEKGFRIYFPSRETVASSKGGIGAGGTICFQSKWYDLSTFPRSLLRDCKSERPGLLMHNKMLFARPRKPLRGNGEEGDVDYVAWVYVGSANLSESAWGRLVKDKTTKQPKLNIRNWECGVIVPIPASGSRGLGSVEAGGKGKESVSGSSPEGFKAGPPTIDVFKGVVPVPMVVPGEEYGRKRPWFYAEH